MNKVTSRIKKDDKVKIITGKDNGKIGKVVRVIRKSNRVVVENINVVKCHVKPSPSNPQGGIVDTAAPFDLSNVMLMCSSCVKPTRIKMKTLEDGKKVRVCAKCNEILDA